MNINENIALAKSILKKQSIAETDEDYLKIRELVGNSFGYVGILTRLRYIDGVDDFEELKSIFDVLKNSKIDAGKLNKMSYDQILDVFYTELDTSVNKDKEDLELVFKDSQYSYYRVHTYKGIMRIGSPTWCLKTKSNWDKYQEVYPDQWVIIHNKFVKNIITPDNNYLKSYAVDHNWIRYGISIQDGPDNTFTFVANDDMNNVCKFDMPSYTFMGILFTVINLRNDTKKSYYEQLRGCEPYAKGILKVVNKENFYDRIGLPDTSGDTELFVALSESYSYPFQILMIGDSYVRNIVLSRDVEQYQKYSILSGANSKKILEDKAKVCDDELYSGLKIKLGYSTLEQEKSSKQFITQIGQWLIFNRNSEHYLVVNALLNNEYAIPANVHTGVIIQPMYKDSMFFYIKKKDYTIFGKILENTISEYSEIIDFLKEKDGRQGVIKKFKKFINIK